MRVVSLISSATEILHALGAARWQVGRSHECDWPPSAATIPMVTRSTLGSGTLADIDATVRQTLGDEHTIYELDDEKLRGLEPDLIITQSTCDVCAVSATQLEAVTCTLPAIVLSLDPVTLDDVVATATLLGERIGLDRAGRALSSHLQNRLDMVAAFVSGRGRPRVAVVEWADPLFTAGHWVPDMITAAGGVSVLGEAGHRSRRAEMSELIDAAPDVVALALCGFDLDATVGRIGEVAAQPGWEEATANARVVAVDGSAYFSRPGPRLVDGVELLAWVLHEPHPSLRPPPGRYAFLPRHS